MSEELGSTHWYLRLLRDESASAERVARLLASSRYATDLLLRAPEGVALLASEEELQFRTREALLNEVEAATGRHDDPVDAVAAARAVRRRELIRIAASDVLGVRPVEAVAERCPTSRRQRLRGLSALPSGRWRPSAAIRCRCASPSSVWAARRA